MIAYKGFDKNLSCRDFHYEIGGTYEMDGELKMCERGFHACLFPLDCFRYYPPATSRYCIVDLDDHNMLTSDKDSKACSWKITIVMELGIDELRKEAKAIIRQRGRCSNSYLNNAYEYVHSYYGKSVAGNVGISECHTAGMAVSGLYSMSKVEGNGIAAAQNHSVAVAGNSGLAVVTSGVAKAGAFGMAVAKEYLSNAETGDNGWSMAFDKASSGNMGVSVALYDASTGEHGIAVVLAVNGTAMGGTGAMLVFKKAGKSVVIDGKKWLPYVWYKCDENDKIVKA